jgi:hypothetical protein
VHVACAPARHWPGGPPCRGARAACVVVPRPPRRGAERARRAASASSRRPPRGGPRARFGSLGPTPPARIPRRSRARLSAAARRPSVSPARSSLRGLGPALHAATSTTRFTRKLLLLVALYWAGSSSSTNERSGEQARRVVAARARSAAGRARVAWHGVARWSNAICGHRSRFRGEFRGRRPARRAAYLPRRWKLLSRSQIQIRALSTQTLPIKSICRRLYHKNLCSPMQIFYHTVYLIFPSDLLLHLY